MCVWIVLKSTIHAFVFSVSAFYFIYLIFLFEKHVNVGVIDLPVGPMHYAQDPLPL